MKTSPLIEEQLKKYAEKGILVPRTEKNQYLKVSYKGAGGLVPDKWNVKIYTSGSVVCVDMKILQDIAAGTLRAPDESKAVLQIDDAGWGFCLLGVMVGVCDGKRVKTDVVDVSFFQDPAYENKEYLREYARKGWNLVTQEFGATPETHRIEICSGYVNRSLKALLRDRGYEVNVVEVKGLLQDDLERLFREYVERVLGEDLGYDPKELMEQGGKSKVAWAYKKVLNWGYQHAPHLLKTGWKSLGDNLPNRR